MIRLLNIVVARTTDRARAESSRWRWGEDGKGGYRLRLRGMVPLSWVNGSRGWYL